MLREIVDQFIRDFNDLGLLDDVAVREPPSKHQRKLRQLTDMVRVFEATYALKHSDPDYILKHEGGGE